MTVTARGSLGLPRWLAGMMAVLGLLAIGTGMRAPTPRITPPVVVVAADSTFPPFRGFMMDSLRRGRLHPDSAAAAATSPGVPRRRPAAARPDSTERHYDPRGCMPE